MDHRDLDLYLLARRQQKVSSVVTAIALLLVIGSGVLLLLGTTSILVKGALIGSAIGILLANSEFGLYGMPVSRRVLLSLLENQINRDADALAYVSRKS
jgi:glucan phosphoethanolaminetransferase (alkaline phosphatase superfamily)